LLLVSITAIAIPCGFPLADATVPFCATLTLYHRPIVTNTTKDDDDFLFFEYICKRLPKER